MKHRNVLKMVTAVTGLLALASPLSSALALTVTNPGRVLMIDGTDPNVTVNISVIDGTFPLGKYDFGFVSGSAYTMITSTIGSYTFAGGALVDFALRDIAHNLIYNIANPIDYANQVYTLPIDPIFSRNPVVTSPYYHGLTLTWDLNKDGVMDAGFDLAVSTPLASKDGVAPAPVPVPAAVWLLGSGLVGLLGAPGRRRKSVALPKNKMM